MRFSLTGIKDLIPQQKNDSYEGFEDLIDRCNVWMKERTDILVINMQSVIVQQNDGNASSYYFVYNIVIVVVIIVIAFFVQPLQQVYRRRYESSRSSKPKLH